MCFISSAFSADDSIDTGFNMLTVLAPTNEAFAKLDKDIRAKLIRKGLYSLQPFNGLIYNFHSLLLSSLVTSWIDNLPILRKLIRFHFVEDILSKAEVQNLLSVFILSNISPFDCRCTYRCFHDVCICVGWRVTANRYISITTSFYQT